MSGRKQDPAPGSKSETASSIRDAVVGVAGKALAGVALTADAFAKAAGVSGLYEIEAGKIALQRSKREDVRQFAQRMIADHTDLAGKLGSFLGGMNRPQSPPETLDKPHQILIDDLKGAADADFDKRYIAQQQSAHSEAMTLLKSYRDHGADEGLRNLAALALPVIERHMELVRALAEAA